MQEIKFYRVNGNYGYMSNFAPYPFELDGKLWPTSEHYFQAQKFLDQDIQERIRLLVSPMDAALEGRNRQNPLRDDWESVKDKVMRKAIYEKFRQHPYIVKELLATGDSVLIEHTSNDAYWADGGDGSGQNKLGQILMEVREEFSKDDKFKKIVELNKEKQELLSAIQLLGYEGLRYSIFNEHSPSEWETRIEFNPESEEYEVYSTMDRASKGGIFKFKTVEEAKERFLKNLISVSSIPHKNDTTF